MVVSDLVNFRKAKSMSQRDVAELAEISRQYYNYIERGVRIPPVRTAKRIASVLNFDWKLFFEDTESAS